MATNQLTKITKRAKAIRRAHPGKSWRTAVKDAGREYRTGKLKRKAAPRKRKAVRKRARPRRRVGAFLPTTGKRGPRETVIRTRSRVGAHKRKPRRRKKPVSHSVARPRRRRVGQSATSTLMPIVALGGLGLLAYALLRKPAQPAPAPASGLATTGNQYRDATAQRILAYATAAGIAADAIWKLIQSLNRASDADVNQIYDSIESGSGIPWDYMAGLN